MNLELIGSVEIHTVGKSETRNRNDAYWSMQLSRRKGHKKSRSVIKRRNV